MTALDPGVGWRLLNKGEVIQVDDEYLSYSGVWRKTNDAGLCFEVSNPEHYRRKVEQADGWIKLSERLPDAFPCEVYSAKTGWQGIAHTAYSTAYENVIPKAGWPVAQMCNHDHMLTHWKLITLSAPPSVEDPEQKAYDAWYRSSAIAVNHIDLKTSTLKAFKAGIAYARKKEKE